MNDTTQFLTGFGGLAVFAAVFADQAGLPIPAPPLLLAAGALVAAGQLNPVPSVGMTAAALLADSIWFYLGRKGSGRALHWFSRWSFSRNASSAQTGALVARYGLLALAVAKFLPGTVMPALAGALGMSTRRFLLFDGLASLVYGGCYITAGFLFHNQIQQVMVWFDRVGHGVIGLGVVLWLGMSPTNTPCGAASATNHPLTPPNGYRLVRPSRPKKSERLSFGDGCVGDVRELGDGLRTRANVQFLVDST